MGVGISPAEQGKNKAGCYRSGTGAIWARLTNGNEEPMGTVYKKTATKPLPASAKIINRKGERLAEWIDARKKRRTAPLTVGRDGTDRIVITARTYTAKYRDGSGIVREVATGCRDESAARSVLGKLERRAELVKGEVLTAAEDAAVDHQGTPLMDHIAVYLLKLEAEGASAMHRDNVRRALHRLATNCQFKRLANLSRESLERWLVLQEKAGMGARTRNTYRAAAVAFCNWCIETDRLLSNPFAKVAKADENADPRRQRRALCEDELVRLLDATRSRPCLDAMMIRRGKRTCEVVGTLRDETRRRLERLGQERALIYKTLVLTGLRKGELASLTVGQLVLDTEPPYLVLNAADEKNREGSTIPLRGDLAADLREWLADKVTVLQEAARNVPAVRLDQKHQKGAERSRSNSAELEGQLCLPLTRLPGDTPLFTVPRDLVRILDRDLVAAGIARRVEVEGKWKIDKRDERGRTVDVHALRHTFGTLLSKGGVTPRTAQAAMRHSDVNLTMNTYTDPKLLDVAGAMEVLPSLPLTGREVSEGVATSATGTNNSTACQFAPEFVPGVGKPRTLQSIVDKVASEAKRSRLAHTVAVSSYAVKQNNPLATAVNGLHLERETGFEPATSSLGS
jgi:integrase